jgi:hypothetical protein
MWEKGRYLPKFGPAVFVQLKTRHAQQVLRPQVLQERLPGDSSHLDDILEKFSVQGRPPKAGAPLGNVPMMQHQPTSCEVQSRKSYIGDTPKEICAQASPQHDGPYGEGRSQALLLIVDMGIITKVRNADAQMQGNAPCCRHFPCLLAGTNVLSLFALK